MVTHRTFVALTIATSLFGVAVGAPTLPARSKPAHFFPTTVGTKWVYDHDAKEDSEEVEAVETKYGTDLLTIKAIDAAGKTNSFKTRVGADGVFRMGSEAFGGAFHFQLIKLPDKAGEEWTTYTGAWPLGTSTLTARDREVVEIPAGNFEAIKVEALYARKMGGNTLVQWWHAPGVGLVKHTFGDSTRVLKSFTLGKK